MKNIETRFTDIELNLAGLQEGIKPGDTGLEQRLLDIEHNLLNLAQVMREYTSAMTEKGRTPTPASKKADEALLHSKKALHIVAEAMSKAIEHKLSH